MTLTSNITKEDCNHHETTVSHENREEKVNVFWYRNGNENVAIYRIEDHRGNFLDVGYLGQKRIKNEIRDKEISL
ncbi:hypothetical protein [Fodinibius sp. SL11]|uniref:hypothetical protein n=1 Tax=Fodinibius sp. SL11 TaxID=3425690 RepID=UPI003F883007